MKISVLASGSKGNSTYIGTEKTNILIDIGLSTLYIEKKLYEMDVNPNKIDAIIITHTHVDHISGLKVFYKKYHPTVYLTQIMYDEISMIMKMDNYVIIEKEETIEDIQVIAIKTSHDVPDSNGYIIKNHDKSLVYITDTGYINSKNHQILMNHNIYIMESNHDVELLMNGNRPYHIKQRILGDTGHLSNKQASEYLSKFCGDNTEFIFLAHLSHDNNTEKLALSSLENSLKMKDKHITKIYIAEQNDKTELIEV